MTDLTNGFIPGSGSLEYTRELFKRVEVEGYRSGLPARKRVSELYEQVGLAKAFKGVTTNGELQPGLYCIQPTGISTEPVRLVAIAFLDSLTPQLRQKVLYKVDDIKWRRWMNQAFYVRDGLGFEEMDYTQREAALNLLRTSLSTRGYQLSRDIMRLNHTLGELNDDDFELYGEWKYWFAVMGTPSRDKPWGWQLDGHHLIINYFVLGDQVVMTPFFIGTEPSIATSGKYKGHSVMQVEQDQGLALIRTLTQEQRQIAILQSEKFDNYSLSEAFNDNLVLDYAGIPVSKLSSQQRTHLLELIKLYIENMDTGHARVRMDEVTAHLNETYFAWIGGLETDALFYYRVQSPVILIEFDHQIPVGISHQVDPHMPIRQHIHAIVRTPNGNDYGADLLRQHYELHSH